MTGPGSGASVAVSVALCTHNGARFVGEQLRSILGQTLPPSEIVVSDDASSDGTLDVVRAVLAEFAQTDAATSVAVTILENERPLGVTKNFERAVRATSGQLVALSDQDDVWRDDKLARVRQLFDDDPGLLLLGTDARLVDEAGRPLGLTVFEGLYLSGEELSALRGDADTGGEDAARALVRRNLLTGATVVFRRTLLETALPFPAEWVHDEWLAMMAALLGGVRIVEEPLIDYRQHGANQIGVRAPTFAYRVRRMLEPRGDRNRKLAVRSRVLLERTRERRDVPAPLHELLARKAEFEAVRAELPANRLARVPAVLRLFRTGDYGRLASQGSGDVLRDLLQPA
ncbi:glycosyltransferase family 2 protein [Compostimonas suwonensis]|uniref:Glycosyltransferase involved in cell wall biosynthesis n=1 Tax=Compostimonas suwonensis TaxID=1048394 RepID=A0A2M9BUV4_9MICO|nr:glycosyltransferase family 2 protein [Compostimonas suwonensis]PJJ61725.1 glycosyltransferase involved in cell wall biosynthesis [Compostimonas suwonensis]